jgi:hypothetical protein
VEARGVRGGLGAGPVPDGPGPKRLS